MISITRNGVRLRREQFEGSTVYLWTISAWENSIQSDRATFSDRGDAVDYIAEEFGERLGAFFANESERLERAAENESPEEIGVQKAPTRYKRTSDERECIDQIRDAMTDSGFIEFCRGNVMKYRHRGDAEKPGSLGKADWYEQMIRHVQNPEKYHDPRNLRADYRKYKRAAPPGLRVVPAMGRVTFDRGFQGIEPGTWRLLIKEAGATFEGFAYIRDILIGPVYGPPEEVFRVLQEGVKAALGSGEV